MSPPDEYFYHQVSYPHAMVASSDPSWRERYWVSFQDVRSKDAVLTLGLGHYPNQDTQEAYAVLAHGDTQTNVRMARALSPRNDLMAVGPLRAEIVKPYEEIRFILDDNPSGLAFDITWTSDQEPILEDRHFEVARSRVVYDAARYAQMGRGAGTLQGPTGEWTLTPETWWGERDHSWGTRPLPRVQGAQPADRPKWKFAMFCPFQLPEFGVHVYIREDQPGRLTHLTAGIGRRFGAPADDDAIIGVEHDLQWIHGAPAPALDGGLITLTLESGRAMEFELKAHPGRAHLRGGGYEGWNGWFQGHWKGEESLEHETWDLTDESQIYRYAKAGSDHLFEVRHEGQVGYGVMQYVVLPGYTKYPEAVAAKYKAGP
ncbi:hypothetical protein QOZ89_39470 [Pseudofrankia sp. BMG5.37]|nr:MULTISPECIES: hypothetical protein [unclassified Pseudofrankia]MDT3445628.1 hypothetical protein [Pseudofrankia sp. BMG5.37]